MQGIRFGVRPLGFKRRGTCLRLTINYGSALINWVNERDLEAFTQHQVPNYLTQFDDQLFRFALEALFCQWAAMQVNQSLPDYLGISAQPIQGSAMVE